MKITITRSFSRTKQIAAFEPINVFCSAAMEMEGDDGDKTAMAAMKIMAEKLDEFVRFEVEKTIDAELAKRKSPDHQKIQDSAKAEAEHDAGQQGLDLIIDKEAAGKSQYSYREIN
jgi:hypothetical protein